MPELPEVETIANNLRNGSGDQPSLIGCEIRRAHLLWERTLAEPTIDEFTKRVVGQVIQAIGRRGKFMYFNLTKDTLLVHLRMSGDVWIEPIIATWGEHYRLMLELSEGMRLVFSDTRKFGRVWLTEKPDLILGHLGPEPLDDAFTVQKLFEGLQRRHRQLKPLLLDQTFIAGLGNIYTDEALHLAGIHPLTISETLTIEQAERLWFSIRNVLQAGIQRNGTSIDWVYRGGDYQNYLRVYGRAGEPCKECGIPIERMLVGQRGTHFCPQCQLNPSYQD